MADEAKVNGSVVIRSLRTGDVPRFLALIDGLADYEHLTPPDEEARVRLARDATSDPPRFCALVAELEGQLVGYAICFEVYSTFLAKPALYLEDIFVLREVRCHGVGRAFMTALAREAHSRGCARMVWQALDWNAQAIHFYERLGARHMDNWNTYVLDQEAMLKLGGIERTAG
jgi:GNAT superfamily N-acetyltransferase